VVVELIDHMGSDLSVVNAARVSFDKESEWEYPRHTTSPDQHGLTYNLCDGPVLSDKDAKLIKYLAKHNHWTPFGHCYATFRIKAPIFVARQLGKHQVGLVWNEVSRRYVDTSVDLYFPDNFRKRADNVKQGSSDEIITDSVTGFVYMDVMTQAIKAYDIMLREGVCPEQARMVLPQSMMTEWWWSGSIAAFARVCKLRLDPHTQKETRDVAQLMSNKLEKLFPVSWNALMEN
jgi:thymidylate synthase (FAD)